MNSDDKQNVLFVCTGNSVRSQMAEGWMRHLGSDMFNAFSAGTNPCYVHPTAIQVMREAGVDISSQRSKSLKEFDGKRIDYVISLCEVAALSCPTFPGQKEHIKWHMEDPIRVMGSKERKLMAFRMTRDIIRRKVVEFLKKQREKQEK